MALRGRKSSRILPTAVVAATLFVLHFMAIGNFFTSVRIAAGSSLSSYGDLMLPFQVAEGMAANSSAGIALESESWTRQGSTSPAATPAPKVLLYMTTHQSKEHMDFLEKCWPAAMNQFKMLQQVDLLYYYPVDQKAPTPLLQSLPFANVTFQTYTPAVEGPTSSRNGKRLERKRVKQHGAKQALMDAYINHWFDGYDWVMRVNPDVLFRNTTWLWDRFQSITHDAIGLSTQPEKTHSDFIAFRPGALDQQALMQTSNNASEIETAEMHLYRALADVHTKNRFLTLQGAHRDGNKARTVGTLSPVVHAHGLLRHCPSYWSAHEKDTF